MSMHTRRDFLVHSATAAGRDGEGDTGAAGPIRREETTEMTIARWAGASKPEAATAEEIAARLTEKAIEGLGRMARFVKRGDVVWVKPNIGWDRTPQQAANTNPGVVAALVRMCFDAEKSRSRWATTRATSPPVLPQQRHRRRRQAVRRPGRLPRSQARPRGRHQGRAREDPPGIPRDARVRPGDQRAIPKHHVMAGATLCMKNYMGVIENRKTFHQAMPTAWPT